MLDRLKTADRLAELLALHDVVDREVEHSLGQAQALPGHCQGTAVERGAPQRTATVGPGHARLRGRVPADTAKPPRAVDARVALDVDFGPRHGVHFAVVLEQQHLGQVRIGNQQVDRMPDRDAHGTLGDLLQQLVAARRALGQPGEQAGGDIGGIGQRVGNGVVAQLLRQQRPGDVVHTQAALRFGNRQSSQALLGHLAAQFRRAALLGLPDVAEHLRRRLGHQETADRLAKGDLVIGKREIHVRPLKLSAGRASARR